MKPILREITPLDKDDLYFSKFTHDDPMNFPLHYHDDFEITLTSNVKAKRTVGNLVEEIEDPDLVLIAPNVLHCYKRDPVSEGATADVSVIQFSARMSTFPFFATKALHPIYEMLLLPAMGIRFSLETAVSLKDEILRLPTLSGFEGTQLFLDIMYKLATSEDKVFLSAVHIKNNTPVSSANNKRLERVFKFVESQYMHKITLNDIGNLINMSPSAASRFFKESTLYCFIDFLNDYRVDRVANLMLDTDDTISEICYACGFNNIANFNRAFKKRMGMTPSEYRSKLKDGEVPNDGLLLKRWTVISGKLA